MTRWPLIRHCRYWYLVWWITRVWGQCRPLEHLILHGYDEVYLDKVWKGTS